MSFARGLFDLYGAPSLWRMFSDDRVTVRYVFGNTVRECRAIIRDLRIDHFPSEDGTLVKRTLGQLVIGRDETSLFGGVDDPQLRGVFEIEDHAGRITRWSIATTPDSNGIESMTDTFVTINIQQSHATARAQRGFRDAN